MTTLITPPTECQLCNKPITDAVVDGQVKEVSSWAYMCSECHEKHGVGLGMGKGQRYEKQPDGSFVKVGG